MKTVSDLEIIWHGEMTDLTKDGFSYNGNHVYFKDCETEFLLKADSRWGGYVGWRDISASQPYFEFAGPTRVIVHFPKATWWRNLLRLNPFIAFQEKLEREFGWRTVDRD